MITYTVKYRKAGSFFWHKIRNVKGDGWMTDGYVPGQNNIPIGTTKDIRFFVLENEAIVELDMRGMAIKFSKERFMSIRDRASQEAGTPVQTTPR